jgi:hypothetical protein
MIEKCAALALQFHGEMDAEDEMEEENDPVDPVNQSDLDQEDPTDPPAAASIDPGDTGGDDGREQGEIAPFAMV